MLLSPHQGQGGLKEGEGGLKEGEGGLGGVQQHMQKIRRFLKAIIWRQKFVSPKKNWGKHYAENESTLKHSRSLF